MKAKPEELARVAKNLVEESIAKNGFRLPITVAVESQNGFSGALTYWDGLDPEMSNPQGPDPEYPLALVLVDARGTAQKVRIEAFDEPARMI